MRYVIEIPDEVKWIYGIKSTGFGTQDYGLVPVADLTPYTELEEVKNNKVNLCDSCNYIYPECPSEGYDVMFGDGIGNDNICCCPGYRAINEDEIRHKVEQEVWEFARIYCNLSDDEALEMTDCNDMFDFSYSETKAKYDAWKAKKDEIPPLESGQEWLTAGGIKCVLLDVDDVDIWVLNENGCVEVIDDKSLIHFTGRIFPEVAELLRKMREE